MLDSETPAASQYISLRSAIGIYTVLLTSLLLLIISLPSIAIPFYFISGFILNRIVLRRLITWHPIYNTLHNVSSAKLSSFLYWPLTYMSLFVRLIINKIL